VKQQKVDDDDDDEGDALCGDHIHLSLT